MEKQIKLKDLSVMLKIGVVMGIINAVVAAYYVLFFFFLVLIE